MLAGSPNFGYYASSEVDSLLDLATQEHDRDRARGFYSRAFEAIVQDAPAVFLWEPRNFALAHRRIRFDRLRGDAWWADIWTWRIPPDERIDRDRVPLPN